MSPSVKNHLLAAALFVAVSALVGLAVVMSGTYSLIDSVVNTAQR